MERRAFLMKTFYACCALAAIPLSGCLHYKMISAAEENGKLKLKKSDFTDEPFLIVQSEKLNAPVYLSREENQYTALLLLCTHKECEVKPQGKVLVCPCHGSEFSSTGKVLKEPAEKNLFQYKTTSDDAFIYIHLK